VTAKLKKCMHMQCEGSAVCRVIEKLSNVPGLHSTFLPMKKTIGSTIVNELVFKFN